MPLALALITRKCPAFCFFDRSVHDTLKKTLIFAPPNERQSSPDQTNNIPEVLLTQNYPNFAESSTYIDINL
ncbi:hypothetical protein Forpi1262_v002606 [Fusarium oxysporum f. sp. raphani]|uniref:Uncharacterized protein n=1 Tax=Fusarium oxysporum f. sp. raphani TaxID=96318 RepID=A0A8J5PTB8_FUSOX|nr:hypothetical protein Forpi1262_v002606 [Fusarium oxysporum f. sp. raphani]